MRKMQITPYGARLREARKAAGITLEDLEVDLGMTKRTISNYECGRALPTMKTALKLAQYLDRPLSWFVQDYGKEATK